MAADIPIFYPDTFDTSWSQVVQQRESRLVGSTWRSDFSGKDKWFNLITKRTMSAITTRKGDTGEGDFDAYKYKLIQSPKELVTTFDEFDQQYLGAIVLPTSDEVQAHAMAANRSQDATIITAFDADRTIQNTNAGVDITSPFPGTQSIAANFVETGTPVASGLTIAKLRRAQKLMNQAEVPEEGRKLAYSSNQLEELLQTTEATNSLYSNVKALVDGNIGRLLGFDFIRLEGLPVDGNDVRSCFAFHSTGIRFAQGVRKVYMDILPRKRHALQIRTVLMCGAVRTEDEKVVRIYCDQSP